MNIDLYTLKMKMEKVVYSIGHSTHNIETFVAMLKSFSIKLLVDVRHFPGSRRFPHFNKENLSQSLTDNSIKYLHLVELGGRRIPKPDSKNDAWRLKQFRGYADYMETEEFQKAFAVLEKEAGKHATAYMCSEAVWWSCHRSLISDLFKVKGWKVLHIMKEHKADEHPYTSAAQIVNGHLSYSKPKLL